MDKDCDHEWVKRNKRPYPAGFAFSGTVTVCKKCGAKKDKE